MYRNIKSILAAGILFLFAACGNNEAGKEDHATHDETAPAGTSETTAAVKLKDDKLNAVYQHYIHLTTALVNGDAAEAKVAANAIEAGAKEVNGASAILSSASKITAANDIEQQRVAYADLSKEMITMVKSSGLASGELYVDHCPMAMNDKGADWLSNKKDIRNPYFGEKMMNCGEITDTIK